MRSERERKRYRKGEIDRRERERDRRRERERWGEREGVNEKKKGTEGDSCTWEKIGRERKKKGGERES